MRGDLVLVADIVEAAKRVSGFVAGLSREDYLSDLKSQAAVLYEIMVMGEAASKVSQAFKTSHSEVAWRDLVTFRNFYIHAYHRVDHKRVSRAATSRVPAIQTALSALLPMPDSSEPADSEGQVER